MKTILASFLVIVFTPLLFGQAPAAPAINTPPHPFPADAVRMRADYEKNAEEAIAPIARSYMADLQRLLDDATHSNKLNDAVAIQNELDAVAAGSVTTKGKLPAEAKQLRDTFRHDAGEAIASLRERYIADLQRLMEEATRDTRLADALAIRNEIHSASTGLAYLKSEFERELYGVKWSWNGAWKFSFEEDGSHPGIWFAEWKVVKPYVIEYRFDDGNHGTIVFDHDMKRAAINEINPDGGKNPLTLYRVTN